MNEDYDRFANGCVATEEGDEVTTDHTLSGGLIHSSQFDHPLEQDGAIDTTACSGIHSSSPYVVGTTISAVKHLPPAPFGLRYATEYPDVDDNWEGLSQTALCTLRAPLGGNTVSDEKTKLTITAIIRTGVDQGAQLVVVNHTLVAKIYDPLYYEHINQYNYKEHVVVNADGDYSCEAATYGWIQGSPAAKRLTPSFHGTWVADIETCVHGGDKECHIHLRKVPLILIELVNGHVMSEVNPSELPAETRSRVLKKAIEAEAVLFKAGVQHDDYHPRNIIITNLHNLCASGSADGPDVKVIDFNVATVFRHPQSIRRNLRLVDQLYKTWHHKLLSPIRRWHGHLMDFSVAGWCSNEDGDAEQWLWEQFHDDEKFIPVIWDPTTPNDIPRHMQTPSELVHKRTDSVLRNDVSLEQEGCSDMTVNSTDHTQIASVTY
ncbi:hypothetical protein T440DRAFT_472045 [Plenodomus tracheiphilus IPT5]|uniref:Protein kinase domain-containing protein n=1 Tax=Plenodomus tracheiphilus IPT5 TaxID=1408161 RepID=A0A6A7ATV6_9PLEO|nr:hypothetical protein T440DRAFT_472045 [Plenodomus tracheiphilus IPT5]